MTTSVLGGSLRRAGPFAWVGEWLSAWRGVTKGQLAAAALLGVIAVSPPMLQTMLGPFAVPWPALARALINAEIWAHTLLLAIVIADRSVDRGASRLRSYGSAAVLAAIIGTLIGAAHSHFVWDAIHSDAPLRQQAAIDDWVIYTHQMYLVIEATLIGGVASYIYADRREARQMAARLFAASLRRTAQSRAMLESELQAMQARVEPELLFRTLARVRDLYDADRAQGDAMLDELIAYLRAAMPHMRDTASTLGQELELVRAYVAIVESQARVTVRIQCAEPLSGRRLPSLVLLPLAAHLLSRRVGGEGRLTLVARQHADGLDIDMILDAHDLAPPESDVTLEAVRERLAALFSGAASVDVRHVDGTAWLSVHLPDESPDSALPSAADGTGATS